MFLTFLVPAALVLGAVLDPRTHERDDAPVRATGLGSPETLAEVYGTWLRDYDAYAHGEDVLVVGLGWLKGLSPHASPALGGVRIDLADGSLEASVRDLPAGERFDLWLVDNAPASSVRPERERDALVRVGTLEPSGEQARLTTRLDLPALADFDLDLLVVAPSGADPGREGLLYGMPSLFQRVYHEQRSTGFGPRDDQPQPGLERPLARAALLPAAAPPPPPSLIAEGEDLFFEQSFSGNGRTCGTCHPAGNNFTLDPEFISALPANDPLFVAEHVPALGELENPKLMRELGLVRENVDGFDQPGVMRGVPHILALGLSRNPALGGFDGASVPPFERLGWSGDGAPGGGTLREFAIGAIVQHATRRMQRVENVDFRLPTEHELDALEAFQLSVGRPRDPDLASLVLASPIAERGRQLFLQELSDGGQPAAKCTSCHNNAGANASPLFLLSNGFPAGEFNLALDIGNSQLDGGMAEMVDPGNVPIDGGFGREQNVPLGGFGSHAFNVPSLIEAPDTGPYFHDNSVLTLEGVLEFYLGGEFNGSPAANLMNNVDNPPGFGVVQANSSELGAVAAFLRVANALENCRSSRQYMERLKTNAVQQDPRTRQRLYEAALKDVEDAQFVLGCAHLHPDVIEVLKEAHFRLLTSGASNTVLLDLAIGRINAARRMLVE